MNLKNRIIALAAVAAIALPALAIAKHNKKDGKDKDGKDLTSMAFFKADLTGGAGIEGKTADVDISDDDNNFVVNVNMKRINTGMGLRNEHMQTKFLKGKVNAVLTVKKADIKGKKGGEVDGKLKLNDKERDVKVSYKVDNADGDRLKVTANIRDPKASGGAKGINYTDFGWKEMCFPESGPLKVCVKPDVKVNGTIYVSKE
jgi:polyisoprenoid-binding protein YceI